ncbi:MAG: Ig-like domain-containing protein [Spirochaetes bacterium]|jgi:hypothetical protein|nr:Ig-like domain-containing protein [Spirochaetota bacterium]
MKKYSYFAFIIAIFMAFGCNGLIQFGKNGSGGTGNESGSTGNSGNTGSSDNSGSGSRFMVTGVSPVDGATNASLDGSIVVTFNRELDTNVTSNLAITLNPVLPNTMFDWGAGAGGNISVEGNKLILKPRGLLKDMSYHASVMPIYFKSKDGEILDNIYSWHFSTGEEPYFSNIADVSPENGYGYCQGRKIELDYTGGQWYWQPDSVFDDRGMPTGGIYTYWQHQPLVIRVKNNCTAGMYAMRIWIKNIEGPLPSFYRYFNVTLRDANRYWGCFVVEASDYIEKPALISVYLPAGDSEFYLDWLNDAYRQGEYDANLNISIIDFPMEKNVRVPAGEYRRHYQFCELSGDWLFDQECAYTASGNAAIGFAYDEMIPGQHVLTVRAKGYGTMPDGYSYQLEAKVNGVSYDLSLPADAAHFQSASVPVEVSNDKPVVNIKWKNAPCGETGLKLEWVRLEKI